MGEMKITNTEVYGFNAAFRGLRNPMNSWNKSDSTSDDYENFYIGENDMKLAHSLIKGGNEHSKFMRMIHVAADFNMPRYWWSEMDCYHFNTKNSCSTMHKLLNNAEPITKDLFLWCEEDEDVLDVVVKRLEELRKEYRNPTPNTDKNRLLVRAKRLLPEGFLQLRTMDTNYAELRTIYFQRRNHRLKEEWIDTFCKWVESLPYAEELITYEG